MLLLQGAVIHTGCANVCELQVGRCKFPELIHRFWTDGYITESTRSPPGEGRRHLVNVMGARHYAYTHWLFGRSGP